MKNLANRAGISPSGLPAVRRKKVISSTGKSASLPAACKRLPEIARQVVIPRVSRQPHDVHLLRFACNPKLITLCPTGFPPPRFTFAQASFTIATGGLPLRSVSSEFAAGQQAESASWKRNPGRRPGRESRSGEPRTMPGRRVSAASLPTAQPAIPTRRRRSGANSPCRAAYARNRRQALFRSL